MKYVVEGRTFPDHKQAITFAMRMAEEMERPVDVVALVERNVIEVDRKWLGAFNPPGACKVPPERRSMRRVA